MVFDRKHEYVDHNTPVGHIADVLSSNYRNNTNASGYINKIRLRRQRENLRMIVHNDPPPPEEQ